MKRISRVHGEKPFTYHPNLRNAEAYRTRHDAIFSAPVWKCSAGVRNSMTDLKCWHCGEEKPEIPEGFLLHTGGESGTREVMDEKDLKPLGFKIGELVHVYCRQQFEEGYLEIYKKPGTF